MKRFKLLSWILSLVLITGCVYKMDIQQGNEVTYQQVKQLQIGMTEAQVRNILGTPLLQDPFSPGRWDYVYQLQVHGDLVEQRRLTVFFDESKRLERFETVEDL
ncbi:MAG: outer membrane protein assembly factor BamE [Gammaproteobacteria bacterium]|jgi:outer membrane protein assembly factor BamE